MLNNVYERLKGLIEDVGFEFNSGGITTAEILAYSKGIELVYDYFDSLLEGLFLNDENSECVNRYCKMLNVERNNYSYNELKDYLLTRLKERFSFFTMDEFDTAFEKLGAGSYSFEDGKIEFSDLDNNAVKKLGDFISGYVPFCVGTCLSGNPMSFDKWDRVARCWNVYDSYKLNFDIIDGLGDEEFE